MAIPWMLALKAVPWGDVIDNAPRIADGAKKLWDNVAQKKATAHAGPVMTAAATAAAVAAVKITPEAAAIAALTVQLAAAEAATAAVHQQVVSTLEMTTALAEQNALLVCQLAILQRRLSQVVMATAVVAVVTVVAVSGLALLLVRQAA